MRTMTLVLGISMAACGSGVETSSTSSATSGGGGGGGSIGLLGDTCAENADCASDLCVDMGAVDSGCVGKVCTEPCSASSDCPDTIAEADCDSTSLGSICLYGPWAALYCGK